MKIDLEVDWVKVAEDGLTRANVTNCLSLAVAFRLLAENRAERAAGDEVIRKIGEISELLLGKTETRLIGHEMCLRAHRGFPALFQAGEALEGILSFSWAKVIPDFVWSAALSPASDCEDVLRPGLEGWEVGSIEEEVRSEQDRVFRKFGDTFVSELPALAKSGDDDAKDALAQLREMYRTAAARLGLHFLHLGPEEVFRRLGRKYPSGELIDADDADTISEGAPADEAAAVSEAAQ